MIKSPHQGKAAKKVEVVAPTNIAAEFQTRKTFADHLAENFASKDRHSYYQRFLILVKNIRSGIGLEIKTNINQILTKCNTNLAEERVTGLCLYYADYCLFMFEGSEDVLGIFLQCFSEMIGEFFELAKILVIVNNITELYFNTVYWRTAIPPSLTEKFEEVDEENILMQHEILNERFMTLCIEICERMGDGTAGDGETLPTDYTKYLIALARIEFVLRGTYLIDVADYVKMYGQIPPFEYIDEKVWPVPYDYTPFGVFAVGKYEVNLTFKDAHKLL